MTDTPPFGDDPGDLPESLQETLEGVIEELQEAGLSPEDRIYMIESEWDRIESDNTPTPDSGE